VKLVRPTNARSIDALLSSLDSLEPNYSDVGASLAGRAVSGFRSLRYEIELSASEETFARAVLGLRTWEAHRIPRVKVVPERASVTPGASLILEIGPQKLAIAAPCRIVGVVDEPDRFGFAYGTLPGHPECGEEAFVVGRSRKGRTTFEIFGFSRPGSSIVRLSGPIARMIQLGATNSYLRALKRFAEI